MSTNAWDLRIRKMEIAWDMAAEAFEKSDQSGSDQNSSAIARTETLLECFKKAYQVVDETVHL